MLQLIRRYKTATAERRSFTPGGILALKVACINSRVSGEAPTPACLDSSLRHKLRNRQIGVIGSGGKTPPL